MLIVHIAINGNGKRFQHAVEVYGRLIPFYELDQSDFKLYRQNISKFKFWESYGAFHDVKFWKRYAKRSGAVRFQRVTVTRHD